MDVIPVRLMGLGSPRVMPGREGSVVGVDMVAGLTVVMSCLAWSGIIMLEEVVGMTIRVFGRIYGSSLTCVLVASGEYHYESSSALCSNALLMQ